jgi:hypothetical protein
MSKSIKTRIQNKHDIEANWVQAKNFVPLVGEIIIYDADDAHVMPRIKIGDGKTPVNDLGFMDPGIDTGTTDPDVNTVGQFYFKYSNN